MPSRNRPWQFTGLARLTERLAEAGVEVVGDLASPRRPIGMVVLSGKDRSDAAGPQ